MKMKHSAGLLCLATLVLAACGSSDGSSGGGAAATVDTGGDPAVETPDEDITPVTDTPPDDGDLSDIDSITEDWPPTDLPPASAVDPICSSHTPTTQSTIGNSLFAFDADPGQCFGVREAFWNGKRLIPTLVAEEPSGSLGTVGEGRLKIDPYGPGSGTGFTFAIDVSNTGSQTACVSFTLGSLLIPSVRFFDSEGEEIASITLEVLGDQYQAATTETTPSAINGCIPAGETRIAWGSSWLDIDSPVISRYERAELSMPSSFILNADAERAADLSPLELSWTAFGRGERDQQSGGTLPYKTTVSILNPSMQSVGFLFNGVLVVYLDEDGFVTGLDSLYVPEALGDVAPEDLIIAPAGGVASFESLFSFIVDEEGRPGGYRGPATRALVYMERCFGEACDAWAKRER